METLLLRVRGETVKFSSFQKTKESNLEKELIKDIETLEKIENPMAVHTDLLCDKKVELEDLRKDKVKGQMKRTDSSGFMKAKSQLAYFAT